MQNQNTLLLKPPSVELKELKNLFFQLSSKSCNLNCKYCYIEKSGYKKEDDFMAFEKIKNALADIRDMNLNSIYLTGGEPMLHPDFNKILRMCLKISNVTVLTNGTLINEKKARFLRKIDDESNFETIYRISLDSVDETENDSMRGRGNFRKAIYAIMSLYKYEFNPIISVVNYKNKPKALLFSEFQEFFSNRGFDLEDINLKVIPYFPKTTDSVEENFLNTDNNEFDCKTSRIMSANGVFACPVLVDDYRARLGSTFKDFSKINYLDCEQCSICTSNKQKVLVNDWM